MEIPLPPGSEPIRGEIFSAEHVHLIAHSKHCRVPSSIAPKSVHRFKFTGQDLAYLLFFAAQFRDWMIRRLQMPRTVPIYRVVGGLMLLGTLFMFAKFAFNDI